MKEVVFALLIFSFNSNGQTLKGTIKDSITKESIAYSSIALLSSRGTYANKNGEFELDIKNHIYDTLKISTVGYDSKIIPIKPLLKENAIIELNLLLSPKIEQLEEVVISSKKKDYKDKVLIGEGKNGNIGQTSLIGYETCINIDNPRNIKGRVKRVYVDLKKNKKASYIATFNIKFYEYDSLLNEPGKELYNKNIFVFPKNKKYRLWINVEDFKISFPKQGICIGVEMVNTIGNVEEHASFGPMFRYTFSEKNKSITWSNYLNTGWKNGSNVYKKFKNHKVGVSNPMIGIEVLYPSN